MKSGKQGEVVNEAPQTTVAGVSNERKIELYDGMLGYLSELISDEEELRSTLKNIGFTDEELDLESITKGGE